MERDLYAKRYFETFEEAYEAVAAYIEFYNERRFHGSLQRLSPKQYQAAWKAGKLKTDRNNAVNEKLRKHEFF
ncbi:IS3 family transposase [Paenibacillus rhizoplanae]